MKKIILLLTCLVITSPAYCYSTSTMTTWMGEVENNIDRNTQDINMNKTNIETNANNIEYQYYVLDQHDERIKSNSTDIINTNQRLDMVQQSGALLQEDVYKMGKKVNKNTNTIKELDTRVRSNTNDIQLNKEAIRNNSERILTNTSAINSLSNKIYQYDTRLNNLDRRVDKIESKMESGFATMSALAGLHPNPKAKGRTQVAVAGGMYKDNVAGAVGIFHNVNNNIMLSVGAAYGGKESWAGNVGINFSW